MRLFKVSLSYYHAWNEKDKEALPAKITARAKLLHDVGIKHTYDEDKLSSAPTLLVNGDQILSLMSAGEEVKIDQEVDVPQADRRYDDLLERFEAVTKKAELYTQGIGTGDTYYNAKCEVYTPGMGLMMFNETLLLEDSCSDELQNALNQGWRIIAACPQPDARRPDYVLGRYNPAYNMDSGMAKRAHDLPKVFAPPAAPVEENEPVQEMQGSAVPTLSGVLSDDENIPF